MMDKDTKWYIGFLIGLVVAIIPPAIGMVKNPPIERTYFIQADIPYLVISALGVLFVCLWVIFHKKIRGIKK
jgi:hypothetical protein